MVTVSRIVLTYKKIVTQVSGCLLQTAQTWANAGVNLLLPTMFIYKTVAVISSKIAGENVTASQVKTSWPARECSVIPHASAK